MEYFAADPRVLMSVGKYYKTGEPMPQGQLDKFGRQRGFSAESIFSRSSFTRLSIRDIMDNIPLKIQQLKY
jgi:Zn-dependent oligopeptidase